MKLWAIGYQFQEDVFMDFEKHEDVIGLSENCFLPTKQMAEEIIKEQLEESYVPVEITIVSYREGVLVTERGPVERWDEEDEDDEEEENPTVWHCQDDKCKHQWDEYNPFVTWGECPKCGNDFVQHD